MADYETSYMDIQHWVNTIVRYDSDDRPSQHRSQITDALSSRPKRRKRGSDSHNCYERTLLPPDRARMSEVCELKANGSIKDRELVKDTENGPPMEIPTCGKGVTDSSSSEYKRKPRRKTRPGRYDLKDVNIPSGPKRATKKQGKKDEYSRKVRSKWPIPSGSAHLRMTGLCPSRPRLSLPVKEKFGSQCRAQSAQMRPGLPDLVFTDMTFLEKAEKRICYCGQERQGKPPKTRDRKHAMQEEISSFFKDRKAPLAEKDINVVQNDKSGRNKKSTRPSETKNWDLVEATSPTNTDKNRIDFMRRKDNPKSSSYFSWSASQRGSSIPAVDSQSKTEGLDYLAEYPKCPVHDILGEEAIRSVSSAQFTNGELNKSGFIKEPLKTKEALYFTEGVNSFPTRPRPTEGPQWPLDGSADGRQAERKARRNKGISQIWDDELNFRKAMRAVSTRKLPKSLSINERTDVGSTEHDICRSSSSVGRLLKECDYALARDPCREESILPDTATKPLRTFPEKTKEYSPHDTSNNKPQYETDIRSMNDWRDQLYGPCFQHKYLEPLPINEIEARYDEDTQKPERLDYRFNRDDPRLETLSNDRIITTAEIEALSGFWKPQKLY